MTDINDVIAETNAAINSADAHANAAWKEAAYNVVKKLALSGDYFTSNDVIERLKEKEVHTHTLRAIGAVMRKAHHDGIIEFTGEYRPNLLSHMAPCRVWVGVS